jgi:hypothetical protein
MGGINLEAEVEQKGGSMEARTDITEDLFILKASEELLQVGRENNQAKIDEAVAKLTEPKNKKEVKDGKN